MKRVKAACICQTLHFRLKEDVDHNFAVKLVKEEVAHYKASMDRSRTKYKIVEEIPQGNHSQTGFTVRNVHAELSASH